MKNRLRVIGRLSIVLLVCVLLGQGVWLLRVREIKVKEFQQTICSVLKSTIQKFLENENYFVLQKLGLAYGLTNDNIFYWKYGHVVDSVYIPIDMYAALGREIIYDCLFYNDCIDINEIKSIYLTNLQKEGITQIPALMIRDGDSTIMTTKNFTTNTSSIVSSPVDLGYDYKHQLMASFELPFIFKALSGVLFVEAIFLVGFLICLFWQWTSIQMTIRSVRVQTMGIAHLEHELKKPLATMISAIGGILKNKDSVLSSKDEVKLGMVKARLMKMADITDTMLTSLKTSVLEIEREVIDLRLEMEMIVEMFAVIRMHAEVHYRIAEGVEYPYLDNVYFSYLVMNLVDNGIKYGGEKPIVTVDFSAQGDNYLLTVEDNGMGIAPRDQKYIFKQFYRVKNQQVAKTTGFGLGLTFVQKVVSAYGGEVFVESKLGAGSKFTVILPQENGKIKNFVCRR